MPTTSKTCPHCKTELPMTSFSPNDHYPDGVQPMCKRCRAEIAREQRAAQPKQPRQRPTTRKSGVQYLKWA